MRRLALAAAAASALLVASACGSTDPGPTETSTVGTVQPTLAPSPTEVVPQGPVAVLRDGYLPVPSFELADVDWNAVGPGWFLVEWKHEPDRQEDTGSPFGNSPRSSDGLSLIAPDGTAYAVRTLKDLDASQAILWLGDRAAIYRETAAPSEGAGFGDVELLDLATGATDQVMTDAEAPQWRFLVDPLHQVGSYFGGEYENLTMYDNFVLVADLCAVQGTTAVSMSPDGERLVCLSSNLKGATTQTDVRISSTSAPFATKTLTTFTRKPWAYQFAGWLDDSTFLFAREGDGDDLVYFSYNIDTDKLADYTPASPGSGYVSWYDITSDTYRIETTTGVTFYDAAGATLAAVPCRQIDEADRTVVLSGDRALVSCRTQDSPALATVTLVDLDGGGSTVLVDVVAGQAELVRAVFGYEPGVDR